MSGLMKLTRFGGRTCSPSTGSGVGSRGNRRSDVVEGVAELWSGAAEAVDTAIRSTYSGIVLAVDALLAAAAVLHPELLYPPDVRRSDGPLG